MKKIVLLILMAFLLTGCDAIYQAEIKDGRIVETTNFLAVSSDNISLNTGFADNPNGSGKSLDKLIDDYYNQDYLAFDNGINPTEFYQKKKITYEGRSGVELNYTYSFLDYQYSSLIQYCFDNVNIEKSGKYLTLDLSDSDKCFTQDVNQLLKSLRIQILADDVVESNADSVSDNIYVWDLSIDNPNKAIHLKAKVDDGSLFTPLTVIEICIGTAIITFLIAYKLFDKKYRNKKK